MTSAFPLALEDRLAITDVLHRFFWLVDHGRAGDAGGLFAADARLVMGPGSPSPGAVEGPAIAAMFATRQTQSHVTTRHVISNLTLAAQADGTVAASCILTFYRADDETRDTKATIVADIDETYTKIDGAWRIAARTVTPIFKRV